MSLFCLNAWRSFWWILDWQLFFPPILQTCFLWSSWFPLVFPLVFMVSDEKSSHLSHVPLINVLFYSGSFQDFSLFLAFSHLIRCIWALISLHLSCWGFTALSVFIYIKLGMCQPLFHQIFLQHHTLLYVWNSSTMSVKMFCCCLQVLDALCNFSVFYLAAFQVGQFFF